MAVGPVSKLTEKEKRFAAALAAGLGPTAAYRQVYSSVAGNRAAQANGRQVAKRERVIAEVERLRRYPPAENFRAIQDYAVAKLIDLAENDANPMVRHKAMISLLEHAQEGLRQPQPPQPAAIPPDKKLDKSKIIAELRLLYAKALGTRRPAQIESAADSAKDLWSEEYVAAKQDDTRPADRELGAVCCADRDSVDGCADVEEQRAVCQVVTPGTTAGSADANQYEWVYLPGHFGKARRVRVRVR
jgi:hypothetical protein